MRIATRSLLVSVITLLGLSPAAHATLSEEYIGIRSSAMGGTHRAIGTSNDSLVLNPAGMALSRRYAVDLESSHNNLSRLNWAHLSAVDSKSSPVAAGVAYTYVHGDRKGTRPEIHWLYFGLAYPIAKSLSFGFTSKHVRGEYHQDAEKQEFEVYTGDVGLQFQAGNLLSFGLSYNNLIATDQTKLLPPTVGTGIAFKLKSLLLSTDVEINITDPDHLVYDYRVGGEYFVKRVVPIRVGYVQQDYIKQSGAPGRENLMTLGLGYLNQTGSMDLSFVRSIERENNWTLTGGVKFFI